MGRGGYLGNQVDPESHSIPESCYEAGINQIQRPDKIYQKIQLQPIAFANMNSKIFNKFQHKQYISILKKLIPCTSMIYANNVINLPLEIFFVFHPIVSFQQSSPMGLAHHWARFPDTVTVLRVLIPRNSFPRRRKS